MRNTLSTTAMLLVSISANAEDDPEKNKGTGVGRNSIYFPELIAINTTTIAPYSSLFGYDQSNSVNASVIGHGRQERVFTRPTLDVRVWGPFTLGGTLMAGYSYARHAFDGTTLISEAAHFGFVPRVGAIFPLGARFAIFPRVGVGYMFSNTSNNGLTNRPQSANTDTLLFQADASLLMGITDHIYASVGPNVALATSSQSGSEASTLRFGGTLSLGISLGN